MKAQSSFFIQGELSHRKQWAEESCGIIFSDIFKSCREFLTDTVVTRYHANCLFDACRCVNENLARSSSLHLHSNNKIFVVSALSPSS